MTKYILHCGRTSIDSADNRRFFREIVKGLKGPVKILLVYFSRDKKEWSELFKQDKEKFQKYNPRKNFIFNLAQKDKFRDQIKKAKVIHLRGGDTNKLIKTLKKYKNFKNLFENKVVVGSSAGAYVLSKYYLGNQGKTLKGLDILPIKVICHYSGNLKGYANKLRKYKGDLKIYLIPEQKYIVV